MGILRTVSGIAMLAVSSLLFAHWMAPDRDVPFERLVANAEGRLKANPNDGYAHYLLGRLHSLEFSFPKRPISVYWDRSDKAKFDFPSYTSPAVSRDPDGPKSPLSAEQIGHLVRSIQHYNLATTALPNNDLAWFGYAWITEQAAKFESDLRLPGMFVPAKDWVTKIALGAYRKAYQIAKADDLKPDSVIMIGVDSIFVQSGEAIKRLTAEDKSELAQKERAELDADFKLYSSRPKAITPILIGLNRSAPFEKLINRRARVYFDLAGDEVLRQWPWIRSNAAWLVWDAEDTGRIRNGRQLFGNAMFWMFFSDGYAALASLDDNQDGWLRGMELHGISAWNDLNENGVSDRGEVTPIYRLGIRALRTKFDTSMPDALSASKGVLWSDGKISASYDWIPSPQIPDRADLEQLVARITAAWLIPSIAY